MIQFIWLDKRLKIKSILVKLNHSDYILPKQFLSKKKILKNVFDKPNRCCTKNSSRYYIIGAIKYRKKSIYMICLWIIIFGYLNNNFEYLKKISIKRFGRKFMDYYNINFLYCTYKRSSICLHIFTKLKFTFLSNQMNCDRRYYLYIKMYTTAKCRTRIIYIIYMCLISIWLNYTYAKLHQIYVC